MAKTDRERAKLGKLSDEELARREAQLDAAKAQKRVTVFRDADSLRGYAERRISQR